MWIKSTIHTGFTLLELLVVVSIITMLIVGATAGYGNFSNKNLLKQTMLTLKNDLRLAQTNALSGKKPQSDCTKLTGYSVSFTDVSYVIEPVCSPASLSTYPSILYPSGIVMSSPPSPILFYGLSNGTNISGTRSLMLSGTAGTYTIDIKDSGDIIDKGFSP
jgi:prepilin-type N-terminal cleavage/methylation domain-containing protein